MDAQNRGLLLLSAGLNGNVIRLLISLIIKDDELEEGLTILEQLMEAVFALQFI